MHGYRCLQQRHEFDDYASLCIPLNELCDGVKQCPLGDDEHEKRCRKFAIELISFLFKDKSNVFVYS